MRPKPPKTPDDYVELQQGWVRHYVEYLREHVQAAAAVTETLMWGHLVYLSDGPVLLIRAEGKRVLFAFWRGKRLQEVAPTLKPVGNYEMATIEIHEGQLPSPAVIESLVSRAVLLNKQLGNPQDVS
ncbi:hypothetical protein BRI6_0518 [plant metagenome]|uniref:YdhG-like domain-containing protein n=1 Tax=plant metagenome TaxID=1297885 RepID=A0A484TQ13_9ZZZZ